MDYVTSPDGTSIAFHRRGQGPPLVLVPGTGAANPAAGWTAVMPALEDRFTTASIDRRGCGESGDVPEYAIEREYEDITAVAATFQAPVYLLGHSFGALLALEAALRIPTLRKLILYEPWIPRPGRPLYPNGAIERLETLLAAGEREALLVEHYRESVGMTAGEIEGLKASPAWPARLATAHTLPREMQAEERYVFDAPRFAGLHVPTLLLVGGDSPPLVKESSEVIASALPQARIAVLTGQGHIAMYTAPDLFLREVLAFLGEPG